MNKSITETRKTIFFLHPVNLYISKKTHSKSKLISKHNFELIQYRLCHIMVFPIIREEYHYTFLSCNNYRCHHSTKTRQQMLSSGCSWPQWGHFISVLFFKFNLSFFVCRTSCASSAGLARPVEPAENPFRSPRARPSRAELTSLFLPSAFFLFQLKMKFRCRS